jgi:hypothetical protein
MTGNIGVAGGNPAGFWHTGRQPNILPAVPNPIRNTFPNSRWSEAVIKGKEGGFGADIKMIYACASGLIDQRPNLNKGIEALQKVEFIACPKFTMKDHNLRSKTAFQMILWGLHLSSLRAFISQWSEG